MAKLSIPVKWIDNDGASEEFTVDGYIAGSADRSDNYFFLDLAQILKNLSNVYFFLSYVSLCYM